jgi:hypothetical protein
LDLTAYKAIKKVDEESEYERYKKFVGCLYRIAELSGYYINGIEIVDRQSGKVWVKR